MTSPLVSVVVPTYNGSWCIQETLNSALAQTMSDLEILVVDDCSTDDTADMVRNMPDSRIRLLQREQQAGVSAARNTAIAEAKGSYIALLDHDDLWEPDKLERQLPLFERDPKVGLVFSDCNLFTNGSDGQMRTFFNKRPPRGEIFRALLKHNFILCPTALIRRSALDAVGNFAEDLRYSEEYDLFLRLAHSFPADYVDAPLASYRVHAPDHPALRDDIGIKEDRLILRLLEEQIPGFTEDYPKEIRARDRSTLRREAIIRWRQGHRFQSLKLLLSLLSRGPDRLALLLLPALLLSYPIAVRLQSLLPRSLPLVGKNR
jgi:glycosyltransferase involved in cell wall biosynthesis